MNDIDFALAVVLAVAVLRGVWRGFFRECFGLLGLIGGLVAAVQRAEWAATMAERYVTLPEPVRTGVAFVGVFAIVDGAMNLAGVLFDRVVGGRLWRGLNRAGGGLVGFGKAAAILAFVLLLLHLLPLWPALDESIATSTIGRPLMSAAGDVLRLTSQSTGQPDSRSQT